MDWKKRGMLLALPALLVGGSLACRTADVFIAQATVTPTRTLRPTITPVPLPTNTPVPTDTAIPLPTATATRRPATPRPPTPKPPPTAPPQPAGPTVSAMEFHVNPATCAHAGQTYIKGTVYLDKNNPSARYSRAIVDLGPPDGSTVYATVLTDDTGSYTFVLGDMGVANPGFWGVWLVDPAQHRKSDIGGPIHTNSLPDGDPNSCWAGNVDFWK